MRRSPLTADVYPMKDAPAFWIVEAIDMDSEGECYMVRFSGPDARERAIEYARAKYASVKVHDA